MSDYLEIARQVLREGAETPKPSSAGALESVLKGKAIELYLKDETASSLWRTRKTPVWWANLAARSTPRQKPSGYSRLWTPSLWQRYTFGSASSTPGCVTFSGQPTRSTKGMN